MHTNHRNISRVLAAAVASSGFAVAPMPTFAASLTCTSSTFTASSDGSGNIVVNCTSPGTGASCSLTASPTTVPSSGGPVTLTASNCGTVTSVTKSSSQIASSGTSWTDTLAANTGSGSLSFTYTVQGSSGSDSVVVTESGTGSPPPPPPPPGGAISCSGYAATLVYDLPWTAVSKAITAKFNNSAIVVARFTTPDTGGVVSGNANISSIEYGDGKAWRTGSLSTVPCDLTGTGFGKAARFKGNTQGPSFTYAIGGTTAPIILAPNTTYYLNIINQDSLGRPSCPTSTCNMIIQLTKPFGL